VAPIPGETKVWQYITLMKRIYLIDCPGIVPPSQGDSAEDILLRGVVRVENVEHPAQYIEAVLQRTQTKHIERTYDLKHADYNDDPIELLSILARKGGRLLKGGEPDVDGVAKMVLNDFLRGKIPWFTPPPKRVDANADVSDGAQTVAEATAAEADVVKGRKGQLGEMGLKRSAPVSASEVASESADVEGSGSDDEASDISDFEEFSGEEDEPSDVEDEGEDGVKVS
jgi:nuclear GTP-binding protein